MSQINCPMCGKENPADSEFCQHCQAHLQPPGFVLPNSKKPEEDTVLPDWLKRMRRNNLDYASQGDDNSTEAQQESTGSPGMTEDDETPEWLKRIRGIKSQEKENEIYGKFAKPADESEQNTALQKGREFLSGGQKVENAGQNADNEPDQSVDHSSKSYQEWLRELRRRQYGDDYIESHEQESLPADKQLEDTGALSAQLMSQDINQVSTRSEFDIEGDEQTSKPILAGSEMAGDGAVALNISQQQDKTVEEIHQKGNTLSRRIKNWFKGQTVKSNQQPSRVDKPTEASETPAFENGGADKIAKAETAEFLESDEQAQDEFNDKPISPPKGDGWIIPDWTYEFKNSPSSGGDSSDRRDDALPENALPLSINDFADVKPGEQEGVQLQGPGLSDESATGSAASYEGDNPVVNKSDQLEQDEDQLPLIPPYQLEIPGVTNVESGPLAGLAAIPVAQDFFPGPARKLVSSTQFELSEEDRLHALLLQSLLAGPPHPEHEKMSRKKGSGWLLKLLIAFALLTVMGYMLVNGVSSGPQGFTGGQAGVDFIEQVDALPDGSVILVAAEYDAGYSAEIELAAVDVLRALIKKNSTMVLISTVPEGPILVEDLLYKGWVALAEQDQEQAAGYVFSQRLINLGYLPGGAAALLAFMQNPRQAAPAGFHDLNHNQDSWTALSELGVNQLSDFSSVIVITDRFESSRTWLEQVDPGLGNIPLLFITTAQSLPLLLPYVQSGQAQGLLAGINDGFMAGKSLEGAPGDLSTVTSYQAGIYVLIILLLIGAFIQLSIKVFSRMFIRKEAG